MDGTSNERGETIASTIKLARAITTMTQFDFGRAIGVSHDRIHRLERGLCAPRPEEIDAITRFILHERGDGSRK